jgi:hypothetical protein
MKRILRILLIVGVLAGALTICMSTSQAGPFRRGGYRGYGWGRAYYGPGWGYRQLYRPYGYGVGGSGLGYRNFGWGYGRYGMGYGAYGMRYPVYGLGAYGMGYPGYGWRYPGLYGTSITVGRPLGGFSIGSYPY